MADKKIYQAIAGVMADVGAIGKDSVNEQQRFKYRGIDAVMNALQPAFIKHGIFVYPEILEHTREERQNAKGTNLIYSVIKVAYHFTAMDGSDVVVTVIGEGMDTGDKATNKALSIAFKYACFQLFCIPTEEMKDQDAETHEVAPERSARSWCRPSARRWQRLVLPRRRFARGTRLRPLRICWSSISRVSWMP